MQKHNEENMYWRRDCDKKVIIFYDPMKNGKVRLTGLKHTNGVMKK